MCTPHTVHRQNNIQIRLPSVRRLAAPFALSVITVRARCTPASLIRMYNVCPNTNRHALTFVEIACERVYVLCAFCVWGRDEMLVA